MTRRFLALSALLVVSTAAHAATSLPRQSLVPGGIALVRIDGPLDDPPHVALASAPVMVLREQDHWLAIVGIPLGSTPGSLEVAVTRREAMPSQVAIAVKAKQYVVQKLNVKPGMVDLSAADLERV